MSADQPLTGDELATIKTRAEVIEAGNLRAVSTRVLADDVVRLVAEIERLQARVTRVEALLTAWDEIPDYAPSHYDRGRVDQRHMAAEELATVLEGWE